ncbi:hypothetical protein [Flavobacterium silvaticum]|uniref:Uncharacterized protein n=1 Tax=Flavobacterium silvaticum TaxID=1852020 RepID=A0A972FT22_9FLAO|nr:hypothetical protein [Flavobacterium silvaticum]NMH27020.1 hypothetical protein [Flavobacterium silvaticum]
MDNFTKVSIPVPCHEDWNSMSVQTNGRFCATCAKNVIDFSNKSNEEIHKYLYQNRGKEVCGRFRNEQLEGLKIQIPEHIFYQKMPFKRAFLLVLFATMGSFLFSCSNDDGERQSIDSVEIIDQPRYGMTAGAIMVPYYYTPQEADVTKEYEPLVYEDAADYYWEADTTAIADTTAAEMISFEEETDTLKLPDLEE